MRVITYALATLVIAVAASAQNTVISTGKTATQSSTYRPAYEAGFALDASTDTSSLTNRESQPWWQVDLGQTYTIESIRIWNWTRYTNRLSDFYIFISTNPLSGSVSQLMANPGVSKFIYVPGEAAIPTALTINASGRYVRVQMGRTEQLQIAEIEVIGQSGPPPLTQVLILEWDKPTQNEDGSAVIDLAGYTVYLCDAPITAGGPGQDDPRVSLITCSGEMLTVGVNDPDRLSISPSYVLRSDEGTIYARMTAYDGSGNVSKLSNQVSKAYQFQRIGAPTEMRMRFGLKPGDEVSCPSPGGITLNGLHEAACN